jgi:hypothetical protein
VIIVHAGNRIDQPGRTPPRFPADRERAVGTRIGELLDVLTPAGVVTAAAAGADLLLAEAAMERAVPLHLLLPCPRARFCEVSVADQGPRWTRAYERVLGHVAGDSGSSLVELALEPDDAGFRTANQALVERATNLGTTRVLAVAVRPREREPTPTVTDDFVTRAEAAGLFVLEIDPGH